MRPTRTLYKLALFATTAVLLASCAETRFVMHTAKRLGDTNKSQGDYKVGKPYQVSGVWYYPAEDMAYNRVGIASWYGPNFHGKYTANGEVYDQWDVTAAHKTLPLPSVVRVTNLDNGRSLVVRINDRGPFVSGRIIDLSRRSAQLLGVEKTGTAKVRVQILAEKSRIAAGRARASGTQLSAAEAPIKTEGVGSQSVASQKLPAPGMARQAEPEIIQSKLYVQPQPVADSASIKPAAVEQRALLDAPVTEAQRTDFVINTPQVSALPSRLFVQAGAFSNASNAERVKQDLGVIGKVSVTPISVGGRDLFRVRIGPITNATEAEALLSQVVDAGYSGARTVVENIAAN